MRAVGVDYFPAVTHAPGVGRFARELVRAAVRLEDRPELVLLDWGGGERSINEPALGLAGAEGVRRVSSGLPRRVGSWPGAAALLRRRLGRLDAFQAVQSGWPPPVGASRVLPFSSLPGEADIKRTRAELAGAAQVQCFSREARAFLTGELGLEPARCHQVPVGAEHWWRDAGDDLRAAGPNEERRAVLVLGAVDEDRGHLAVLEAFERQFEAGTTDELIVLGRRGNAAEEFASRLRFSSARSVINWIQSPVEADLPRIVSEAAVLVHLGASDATPVTPLEVLRFGRPAVCLDRPTYREALGDVGHYVEPARKKRQGEPLVPVLGAALESAFDVEASAARRARAERFTWEACARATLDVWRAAADGA